MRTEQQVDWRGPGVLLDIRGHSEAALATSLARIAASAGSDLAGSPVEGTVTLVRPDGTPCTVASDPTAGVVSQWDQRTGLGPAARALDGRLTIILNHRTDTRWPEYLVNLRAAGFRSALSVPLQVERGYRAALTLFSAATHVFTPAVAAQALAFSAVAGRSLALTLRVRADLAHSADLRAALASRTAIDAACGVLMGQTRCSYEAAVQILSQASRQRNLKFREAAESLLPQM